MNSWTERQLAPIYNEPDLAALAAECVLKQANSDSPGPILADYFQHVFDLGRQQGLRQTADSLDTVAKGDA